VKFVSGPPDGKRLLGVACATGAASDLSGRDEARYECANQCSLVWLLAKGRHA
jgi:hypothetical protein